MSRVPRVLFIIALCGASLAVQGNTSLAAVATPVAVSGYTISQWVGPTTAYSHPDSVEVDGSRVWIGYQNVTAKDGSDNKTSTVVAYSTAGSPLASFSVPGHNDGLRVDPTTHLVWASSNEDGNPALVTINPTTAVITPYAFPMPTPHGGGYDDMAFAGGSAFIAASNPNLNSAGVNAAPAVDQISLSAGTVTLTPVLMGNATATDTTTKSTVTLNEVDPDSMMVDPQGDVVLDNQGAAELVFLHNAATSQQTVTRVPLGTQIDDFVWAPAQPSSLLVVDGPRNTVWKMSGTFAPGTVIVEAPSDSGVAGFVGTLDLSTGNITPIAVGFGSPTGLAFLPDSTPAAGVPLAATLDSTTCSARHLFTRC